MQDIATEDIGGRLRRAREHRGLTLHDAARQTRLSINVLRAIERNDFTSLPEGMYRKAYVRMLAAEVGLNPNEIAADYCAWYEPPVEPPTVSNRDPVLQDKWLTQLTPSPRRSLVTLAVLATLSAAWFGLQPDPVRPGVPVDDDASESLVVRTSLDSTSDLTADRARSAATRVAATEQPSEVPIRIEMTATGWCWVAAESDGERVMYRLMEPGEQVVLEGQRMISLRLGNAGSVTLSINEGARRSPGRHGEVVALEVTPGNVEGLRDVLTMSRAAPPVSRHARGYKPY